MARTVAIPSRFWAPGTYQQSINSIPVGSPGFTMTFTRESWPVGQVGRVDIEIAPDSVNFSPWISVPLQGGNITGKDGQPLLVATIAGEWPGVSDGNGGRTVQWQSDVRATLTVLIGFNSALTIQA